MRSLQTLECKTTDPVIVLAGSGKTFTIDAADDPERARRRRAGQHAGQLRLRRHRLDGARATRPSACS